MAAPTGVADSYTTPMNAPLVKDAAAGVLANDTGTGTITAVYVAASATHGSVSLASDGSFTFTPTTNYTGTATFRYKPHNVDGDGAEVTVTITVGDSLEWAHLLMGTEGQKAVEGEGRGKMSWQARADRRNRTHSEILASPKVPQPGDPLRRFKLTAGAYAITRSYEADGAVVSDNVVCVLTEAKQDANNPWLWTITVSYEGVEDPTAKLPHAVAKSNRYQEYETHDIYGRPVTNSAFDPFEGGMPADRTYKSIVITRNLPFESWHMGRGDGYEGTLNLFPWRLGNQVDENGDPAVVAVGCARIVDFTEERIERAKATTVAAAKFYWSVTVEVAIDRRTYRRYRADGTPEDVPTRHRWVTGDAGFNTLAAGVKTPIKFVGVTNPTEPQPLNGAGGLVVNPKNAWPTVTQGSNGPNTCGAVADVYKTAMNTALTVANPGVLSNDVAAGGGVLTAEIVEFSAGVAIDPAFGTLSLASGGGFTFTPATGFAGYASFTYKAREDGNAMTDSAPTTVVIFVAVAPTLLPFERYEYADWSDISAMMEGW